MNSLFTRLSLALLLIMLMVGGGFYWVVQWSTRQYHEELTQRLNSSIAMYVTGQTALMAGGQVNRTELGRLAEQAMVINPSVEVYLLDTRGRILGHALPEETVLLDRVDLGPIKQLVGGHAQLPLYGPDPRNPDREKVFSAFPVVEGEDLQGYLYVVLGGRQYDELAGSIRGSYVRTTSIGAIVALVVGGFLAGLLVFGLMARRLGRLTRSVQAFSGSGFDPAVELDTTPVTATGTGAGGDEITRLDDAFRAMARKIREQFDALQENDRLRRELISNVSHDLRTPLAIIHGYVDTLLLKNEQLDPDERARYLQVTRKHTLRLGDLIGDLFELSKLDSGSMPMSLETFSLRELLHDVVQDFGLEAARRRITLTLEGEIDQALVHADIALVQRVLENLIRNALDCTPEGGHITLNLSARPDRIAVAVSDTGCGIPEDQIGNIFERFYCSDNGHQSNDSSGLGLAIVKRILDLHGSRITVSSKVNEGTRFEFSLPAARAA